MAQSFFESQKKQSAIKSDIITDYFVKWALILVNAMKKTKRRTDIKICFVDLFAGKGRYDDGTPSTPLLILKKAIEIDPIRHHLVSIFNDKNKEFTDSLKEEIINLNGIESLRYRPRVFNLEVGKDIADLLKQATNIPSLYFVDPIGYKGLSLELVQSSIRGWGSEIIFFFNYNRINHIGLPNPNPKIAQDMEDLFGNEHLSKLKSDIKPLAPIEREAKILGALKSVVVAGGGTYVCPFFFKKEGEDRTSHYLVHVSKNIKGLDAMKETMVSLCSDKNALEPSFGFDEAAEEQPTLFHSIEPLELHTQLTVAFFKETLKFEDIYCKFEELNNGTYCLRKDYRRALTRLEEYGKIEVTGDTRGRRKGTFGPKVLIKFK